MENPFAGMFQQMSGQNAHGMDQWMQQATPWLDAMRGQFGGMFNMPAFGLQREQQERWQALGKSQMDYQKAMSGYNAQLMECGKRAYAKFEDKLAERSEPGRQLDSTRAVFDLWIDAAEESWSEVAMTPEFRSAYGDLVNAQSRVRAGVQGEVERTTGMLGMPTRTEVNSTHKKVTQLERDLRALKQQLAELEAGMHVAAKSAGHAASRSQAPETPKSAAVKPTAPKPSAAVRKPAARTATKSAATKSMKPKPAARRAKK